MTLQLLPKNAFALLWNGSAAFYPQVPERPRCTVCGYELIDGWCSRCDLEENGVLV